MRGWRRSGTVACPAGRALRAILMQDRRRTGAARLCRARRDRRCGPLAARPDRLGTRCDSLGTLAASGAFFGRAMRTGSPVSGMGGGSCVSAHRRPSVQADRMGARAVHGRFADVRSVSDSECAEHCSWYAGASVCNRAVDGPASVGGACDRGRHRALLPGRMPVGLPCALFRRSRDRLRYRRKTASEGGVAPFSSWSGPCGDVILLTSKIFPSFANNP